MQHGFEKERKENCNLLGFVSNKYKLSKLDKTDL